GAVFGETIVICNDALKSDFRYHIKQKGALLAKSAAMGIQVCELFKDNLYDELAKHSNDMALKLADGIKSLGYSFLCEAETNQIFPIFPIETIEKLRRLYDFYDWQPMGEKTVIRLVTSWSTPESMVDEFVKDLSSMNF
ncbi:MAG: threonine aldolase, partial [Alphaproteobacteria bacterium]|nr:threonine aldolase [Alphaproteobacteria bacterium]